METIRRVRAMRPVVSSPSKVMTIHFPSDVDTRSFWAFIDAMGWSKYVVEETSSRESILTECCGAWADDPRSTEEIIASARSSFDAELIYTLGN